MFTKDLVFSFEIANVENQHSTKNNTGSFIQRRPANPGVSQQLEVSADWSSNY